MPSPANRDPEKGLKVDPNVRCGRDRLGPGMSKRSVWQRRGLMQSESIIIYVYLCMEGQVRLEVLTGSWTIHKT